MWEVLKLNRDPGSSLRRNRRNIDDIDHRVSKRTRDWIHVHDPNPLAVKYGFAFQDLDLEKVHLHTPWQALRGPTCYILHPQSSEPEGLNLKEMHRGLCLTPLAWRPSLLAPMPSKAISHISAQQKAVVEGIRTERGISIILVGMVICPYK